VPAPKVYTSKPRADPLDAPYLKKGYAVQLAVGMKQVRDDVISEFWHGGLYTITPTSQCKNSCTLAKCLIFLCTNPVSILSVLFKPSVKALNRLKSAYLCLVVHRIAKSPHLFNWSMSSAIDLYAPCRRPRSMRPLPATLCHTATVRRSRGRRNGHQRSPPGGAARPPSDAARPN
jgi:hypothetical protein